MTAPELKDKPGTGDEAIEILGGLGPSVQLSTSDEAGYDDHSRWWCWLPEENGGDGSVYSAWTALGAVKAYRDEDEGFLLHRPNPPGENLAQGLVAKTMRDAFMKAIAYIPHSEECDASTEFDLNAPCLCGAFDEIADALVLKKEDGE
ncbi:MAG: hypothetical protein V3W44_05055, partial [Dehalococcoidales bacterium]